MSLNCLCNSDTHFAVQNAEPFSPRTRVSAFMAWHVGRRSGLPRHRPATCGLSGPSKCRTQGTCLHRGHKRQLCLVPLRREKREREKGAIPDSAASVRLVHILVIAPCWGLGVIFLLLICWQVRNANPPGLLSPLNIHRSMKAPVRRGG